MESRATQLSDSQGKRPILVHARASACVATNLAVNSSPARRNFDLLDVGAGNSADETAAAIVHLHVISTGVNREKLWVPQDACIGVPVGDRYKVSERNCDRP
jgi:hypothetical protein